MELLGTPDNPALASKLTERAKSSQSLPQISPQRQRPSGTWWRRPPSHFGGLLPASTPLAVPAFDYAHTTAETNSREAMDEGPRLRLELNGVAGSLRPTCYPPSLGPQGHLPSLNRAPGPARCKPTPTFLGSWGWPGGSTATPAGLQGIGNSSPRLSRPWRAPGGVPPPLRRVDAPNTTKRGSLHPHPVWFAVRHRATSVARRSPAVAGVRQ